MFGFIFNFPEHQLFSQVLINSLPILPPLTCPHKSIFLWQSQVTLEPIHPTTREVPVKCSTFCSMTPLISYLFILIHCPFDPKNYLMVFTEGVYKCSLSQFNYSST